MSAASPPAQRLAEIQARLEAADLGPWTLRFTDDFIAHARADLPWLLAENARLTELVEVEREAWRIARAKSQHNHAEATRYRAALEGIANASNTSWLADMARADLAVPAAPPQAQEE